MASSPPNKLFDNQRGFPTPDAPPEETGCRVFSIPADEEWFALLMGAVSALTNPYNWYRNGDLTQQEAADAFADIIDAAYALSVAGASCPSGVPTPFWDTATDSDDEYPPGELTPWYGVAVVTYASPPEVTFVESLFIWSFAGFMAYSGAVGAAIAFLTIAPRFVIAFKTGDIGGIVDIIVDASRVGRYNTYSPTPGIMRVPVATDPDLDEHQIYIVKADDDPDTTIQLVRDELNPNDVSPTNRRYNPIDDTVEILNPDDTWTVNDGADPRISPAFQYAPVVADDPACQAAANMTRYLNDLIDEVLLVIAECNDAAGLLTVLVGLLLELGPFGILIDLILALAFILFSAGATAISAAFTNDVYDQLTCIFFANVEPDGTVTSAGLTAIQAAIDADIGGLVATVLDAMLFLMGNVGLTNAGVVGDAPADCSGCTAPWCRSLDLTLHAGVTTPFLGGTWTSGVGWQATDETSGNSYRVAEFWLSLPSTVTIYRAQLQLDITKGSSSFDADASGLCAGAAVGDFTYCASTLASDTTDSPPSPTQDVDIALPSGAACGALFLEVVSSTNATPVWSGSATMLRITVWGENPDDAPDWSAENWEEC